MITQCLGYLLVLSLQRPTGVSVGTLRFNTTIDQAEIYKADDGTGSAGWTPVAGGGTKL